MYPSYLLFHVANKNKKYTFIYSHEFYWKWKKSQDIWPLISYSPLISSCATVVSSSQFYRVSSSWQPRNNTHAPGVGRPPRHPSGGCTGSDAAWSPSPSEGVSFPLEVLLSILGPRWRSLGGGLTAVAPRTRRNRQAQGRRAERSPNQGRKK